MTQRDQLGNRTKRIRSALQTVLPPSVKVKPARDDSEADFVINGIPIQVKWVGLGWPRDIKLILADRRRRPDLVVGHRISPGAQRALSDAGIGWLDETGAAEFAIRSIVVSRTGQPDDSVGRTTAWTTPSVLAVAEALLCGVKPTVSAVQEATRLSSGSCTQGLRFLADQGLLGANTPRGRDSARRILDSDRLLDEYAMAASSVPARIALQLGITWQDVVLGLTKTGRIWDKHRVTWAATGAAASLVLAPFLTAVRTAEVYIDARTVGELRDVAEIAQLRPMRGGRVTLMPFPTVTTRRLASTVDDIRVVPWPRAYADLRTTGVRGEEAAEHLREVVTGEVIRVR